MSGKASESRLNPAWIQRLAVTARLQPEIRFYPR